MITDGLMLEGKAGKAYYTKNTFIQFTEELARHFEKLTLFVPVRKDAHRQNVKGYFETRPNSQLRFENGGDFANVIQYYARMPRILPVNRRRIRQLTATHDCIICRLPSLNAFYLQNVIFRSNKSCCIYLVGDQEGIIEQGDKYKGPSKLLGMALAKYHTHLTRKLVMRADTSVFLGKRLYEKYGSQCKKAEFMFTSLVRKSDIIRRDVGNWPPDPLKVVFAGRIEHEKGLSYLIEAIHLLKNQGANVKLTVCGTGTAEDACRELTQRLKLEEDIIFKGFVKLHPDLDDILMNSDIFVLPSISEGVPKVVLEAMAKGAAVIATDVGGVPEIVKNGENGLLIKPADTAAIVDAVGYLCQKKHAAEKLVREAYHFISQKTIEHQAQSLACILKDLPRK